MTATNDGIINLKGRIRDGKLVALLDHEGKELGAPVTSIENDVTGGIEVSAGTIRLKSTVEVKASGDTTGATDTDNIQSALSEFKKVFLRPGEIYYTNAPINIQSDSVLEFGRGATIRRRNKFTDSATITSGSNIAVINTSDVKQYDVISAVGIPDGTRIDIVGSGQVTLSQQATASGTVTATVFAGHNILYANQKTGFSIICHDGWGYLDGARSEQSQYIKAIHDGNGSGFRFESCTNWRMDGIWSKDNQFHGGFFTSEQVMPNDGSSGISIGRFAASGNNVRGLHARATGTATVWPGLSDVLIDSLYLRENGQVHINLAESGDLKNGGVFLHVGGMRRFDIKSILAVDEYGIALQMWGDDSTADPSVTSKHCHIGSMIAHNCGRGVDAGRGLESVTIDSLIVTGDRLFSTTGAGADVATLSEIPRPALDSNATNYMAVGTLSLPATWTAADVGKINAGDLLQSSNSGTGIDFGGAVVISVDAANKTAMVFCLNDPLGQNTDDADGLVTSITPSGAGAITINGVLAGGYTNARKILIYSAGNVSARTFTVTGTDYTGAALTENVTGPNASYAYTKRLFKTVTSVSVDAACSAAITVGTCLARPFTTTATNQPIVWRAGRGEGIYLRQDAAASMCGDVKHLDFGSVFIEGTGGYAISAASTALRGAGVQTYKGVNFGRITLFETQSGIIFNSAEDLTIGPIKYDSVGRGLGSDSGLLFETKNTKCVTVESISVRHTNAAYSYTGACILVGSDCADHFFGPSRLKTTGTVYASFAGPGCVITAPKRSDTYAALTVAGGDITGAGSPVVWVPA